MASAAPYHCGGENLKFKAEPNLFVRLSNKYVQRATGKKGFYFDDKGEYETENEVLINVLSQNFEIIEKIKEENSVNETGDTINYEDIADEQIRALAKENKIKSWHNKKIENLIAELKGVQ